jgi:signal peptidase II
MRLKKACLIFVISGLFLLLDQFLKWQATHQWQDSYLLFSHIGWELFLNTGAAFSLPVSNTIIIFFTSIIMTLVTYLLIRELKKQLPNLLFLTAWSFILGGAISNLADRIIFGYVIDYFLLGTAIINLADIMIVAGLGVYIAALHQTKKL